MSLETGVMRTQAILPNEVSIKGPEADNETIKQNSWRLESADRLLRIDQVQEKTALGRSTIYRRIAAGAFPKPRFLGRGAVRWRESAIDRWIESLPETRGRNSNRAEHIVLGSTN